MSRRLRAPSADLVWAPSAETMYPDGFATRIVPEGPATAGLEDRFRPHFFGGVATVVGQAVHPMRPDIAMFGEKDYQQLRVVTQMARDLDLTRIVGVAHRARDATASRCRRATSICRPSERARRAGAVSRARATARTRSPPASRSQAALIDGRAAISPRGLQLDYFEARHAETLAPIASREGRADADPGGGAASARPG